MKPKLAGISRLSTKSRSRQPSGQNTDSLCTFVCANGKKSLAFLPRRIKMSNRVPIPRLLNTRTQHKPGRTGRACDECRSRKAKCDGVKPACSFCVRQKTTCHYSEPKRKREQTELGLAKDRADSFEKVLREILEEVDLPVSKKIKRVLVCSH